MLAMVNDLWKRTSRAGDDRRAASQCFGEYDAEWFIPFYRYYHSGGLAQQFVLLRIVNRAHILDSIAIKMRDNFPVPIFPFCSGVRVIACDEKTPACAPCDFNREVRSLDTFHTAKKNERRIIWDARGKVVFGRIDEVVNRLPLATCRPAILADVLTAAGERERTAAKARCPCYLTRTRAPLILHYFGKWTSQYR